jgi:cytochrome P450
VISPPLRKLAVFELSPAMAELTFKRVRRWPRDRELPLTELTESLAVDLATCLLFGDDHERARPVARMIIQGLNSSWFIPTLGYLQWLRVAPLQERAIVDWAAEKQAEPARSDLLSLLANAPDEYGRPPNLERIAALLTFTFAATFETCHKTMAWTLILLTQHPNIAAALSDEIEAAVGDQPPSLDRIAALPRLDAVVKESMRLLPSVPLQFRVSTCPTSLGAAQFERGSRVCAATHLIARSPAIYDEPDRFLPERWMRIKPSPYEYPTFGAGARMCPGSVFGMQMLKTCIAAIIANHRIELARDARIGYRTTVTCAPHGRVGVVFRDRSRPPVRSRLVGRITGLVSLPAAS